MNPFRKSPSAIRSMDEWVGRPNAVAQLRNCVATRENTVLMGLEGSGKSSLLKSYFTYSYRKEMARKERKLFIFVDMSNAAGDRELSEYLLEELCGAARKLLSGDDRDEVMDELELVKNTTGYTPKERYEKAVESLGEMDFFVILLMDHFEKFTSSPSITKYHHDMLRSLIEKDLLQCIVATNYDLEKDSLPADVSGSLYLQKFQNRIAVHPFTLAEATEYVQTQLNGNQVQLTGKQIEWIYAQTGGVPSLFELACSLAYDHVAGGAAKKLGSVLQEHAIPTLERWCKMYSISHMKALNHLLAACREYPNAQVVADYRQMDAECRFAAKQLQKRGILIKCFEMDEQGGNPVELEDVYQINSKLLQWYLLNFPCKESELLTEKRRQADQLRKQQEEEAHEARMRDLAEQAAQAEIDHMGKSSVTNIYNGGYVDNRGATFTTNNVVSAPMVSAEEFLKLIHFGDITEQYKHRLAGAAQSVQNKLAALPTPGAAKFVDVELVEERPAVEFSQEDIAWLEQEHELEQKIAEIANEVLPDVDPETLEDADLDDFERHFRKVRKSLELEEALTDQVLDSLSPLCCFYVKAAVIVEDHMSAIEFLLGGDCSTHLVMYGKCLEQSLRDTLYHLFRDNEEFCDYNTYTRNQTPGSDKTFGGMTDETKAMLGSFHMMLLQKQSELASLCEEKLLVIDGINDVPKDYQWWLKWWTELTRSVNRAKNTRNRVHAGGPAPTKTDLLKLRKDTFGLKGILFRSQVGRELNFRLRKLTDAEILALRDTTQTLTDITVGSKNALDGTLTVDGFQLQGHMAAKVAKTITSDPATLAGQSIQVRLTQYDKQNNWFVVAPL